MSITLGYPAVPITETDEKLHRQKLAEKVNQINSGKFNCVAALTLNMSATTTTLTDSRIGYKSFIWLMPQTAHAATALASVFVPPGTITKGAAVINHASSANADQTFLVLILG